EDGIRDDLVAGVQTCALPISAPLPRAFAGLTQRKVWRDNDSLLRSLLLKTPQLVIGRFRCVNPAKARGSGAVSLALEQLSSEVADDAPPIAYCRASLKARRLGVTAGA